MSSASSSVPPPADGAISTPVDSTAGTMRASSSGNTPPSSGRGDTIEPTVEQQLRAQLAAQDRALRDMEARLAAMTIPPARGGSRVHWDNNDGDALRPSIEGSGSQPPRLRSSGKNRSGFPGASPLDENDDDDGSGPSRRNSMPYVRHRDASFSGMSSMSTASRIEKIPNLHTKLSDGVEYSPKLWEAQVQNSLRRYAPYFIDEDHKKDWLLNQTEGMAHTFLEPAFVTIEYNEQGEPVDALDLVGQLVDFLTNPNDEQTAWDLYQELKMDPRTPFWTFYHRFRTLARKAGFGDQAALKRDLKDKIAPRLRKNLHQEFRKSRNLNEFVAAIQAEDQGQYVERHRHGSSETPHKANSRSMNASSFHVAKGKSTETGGGSDRRSRPNHAEQRSSSWDGPPRSPSPAYPARSDIPRAQSPALTPRHYSSQPSPRPSTPYRVNEIDAGHASDSNSEDDNEDAYKDAMEEPATAPSKKGRT